MATEFKGRKGTAAEHTTFTGAEAEITVNTTDKALRVHDGITVGGFEMARADLNNVSNAVFAAKADAAGISGGGGGGSTTATVTGVTQANPAVVTTSTAHNFADNHRVTFTGVGGMTQINGNTYYLDVLSATTFALYSDRNLATPVNSTGFSAYTSGGTATASPPLSAPDDASFLVTAVNAVLTNERVASAGNGIVTSDGGAGGSFTFAADFGATAPQNLGAASAGVLNKVARHDHVHAMPTATDVGAVPTARTVTAGTGLSGGGALSANITLSLSALLDDLTDVFVYPAAPVNSSSLKNGDVLMYNEATTRWENSSNIAKITTRQAGTIIGTSNAIKTLNFTGLGVTLTADGTDPTYINIDIPKSYSQEEIEDIVGAMVSTNTESGISVTYNDASGKLDFDVNDFSVTLTGDVTGTATVTNLGNVSITTTIAADSVALGTDTTGNYVATLASGTGISLTNGAAGAEGAAYTVALNPADVDFVESVQDIVGAMAVAGTHAGVTVTYSDAGVGTGKINIDVNDPTITLTGVITGSATMTDLGNVSIVTSVANDSIALGTKTTGNYVATLTAGNGITLTNGAVDGEGALYTVSVNTANATFVEAIEDIVGNMVAPTNTENGISVTYDDTNAKLNFDVNDFTITLGGALSGSVTITNLANGTLTAAMAADAVTLGTHTTGNYVATVAASAVAGNGGITVSGSGAETAAVVVGIDYTNADLVEGVQDIVGAMVSTNTESGINVTYDDTNGKLNFNVNDPTITLTGAVTGSATMTDLGNVSIATTPAADSITLGTHTTGNYVATVAGGGPISVTGSGAEGAAVSLSFNASETAFVESIQDLVGSMITTGVSGSVQSGISVTYNDTDGKLNFNVNDPTITLTGGVTGTATMTDLGNVSITTTIPDDSIALGTKTTGAYVTSLAVSGTGISLSNSTATADGATLTITSNATSANTASTIVARNASGDFTAGTITAALAGNASTATKLATARDIAISGDVSWSVSFDGSANVSAAATLATVGTVTPGTYGSASNVAQVTVDGKGRVTNVSNVAITYPVTSFNTRQGAITLSSADVTGALGYTPANLTGATFSGDVSAPNFRDGNANYNVNLGRGTAEGRGVVAGFSGSWYGGIGYNVRHTATTGQFIAPQADSASYLSFSSGGFRFWGTAAGLAGRSVDWSSATPLFEITAAGAVQVTNNVSPVSNNAYNLGASSNRWATGFFTSVNNVNQTVTTEISTLTGASVVNPGIFFTGPSTNDRANGLIWGGAGATTGSQAGVLVQSSSIYGSRMKFYTTDNFTTGMQERMTLGETGHLVPTGNGTQNLGSASNAWGTMYGTATSAQYGDVAERYAADAAYEPGTVVIYGGSEEITASTTAADTAVAGVISTNPAYMLNADAGSDATHPFVALVGRVPCKVVGRVHKGQLLTTSDVAGHAMATNAPVIGAIIGKALADKLDDDPGVVEIALQRS